MSRALRVTLLLVLGTTLASEALFAQRGVVGVSTARATVYFNPYFGGFGGYGFAPYGYPAFAGPSTYAPNYWWVSPYPIGDLRQDGYNPSAGYEWDSVGTLILITFPAKARVKVDGIFVGTADNLGPFQFPVGEHTLRVEAAGYETAETIVRFEQPGVQEVEVQLKPLSVTAKPGPRP